MNPSEPSSAAVARPSSVPLASAVALRYADGDLAPSVVAKGRGVLAEEIIRRAREAGLHVYQSRDLVALLMQVDLDARIPAPLYVAVAEILAWIYRLENEQIAHHADEP